MTEENGPVRLLVFLNSRERAGVEEVALAVAKGLARNRFEVHLAAPTPLLDSFAPDLEGCAVETLGIHLVSFRQWREMKRFIGYLRRRRIQIVNPHRFYATLFAAPLARMAGVPVVIETTHGPEAWRKSWWKRKYWVDRAIEKLVTMNVAVSEANRRYLVSQKGYPARKLHVIPNGRDLAQYESVDDSELVRLRRKYSIAAGARVLAVVGRLDAQKGHCDLLEALPVVMERYPDLRVIFVGDGPLRARLRQVVQERQLQNCVTFAGYQKRTAPFYHLAEFLILPSLYEGMPLAAIEAGAAGRAMIATSVDGTLEVVVHGETGLLVPPSSPTALAGGILRLLAAPEDAEKMGRAARSRIDRMFSLERQLGETSRLYFECFAAEAGGPAA